MANANRVLRAQTPLDQIVNFDEIGMVSPLPADPYFELSKCAENEQFEPASEDYRTGKTVCLMVVDWQVDFIEGPKAHLGVPGSKEDSVRLLKFIYNYMGGISKIVSTQDTHHVQSIFFPTWWVDKNYENNPDPLTIIKAEDVEAGEWIARMKKMEEDIKSEENKKTAKEKALEYCQYLAANNRMLLTIWNYHCEQGSVGAALEPQYFNIQWFHSLARGVNNPMAIKGLDVDSDMYGAFKPEHSTSNFINKPLIDAVLEHKYIIFCGQARNYCAGTTLVQLVDYFMNDKDPDAYNPEAVKKIIVLEDCMSPIGPMTPEQLAVEQYCRDCGVQFRKSTDDFSDIFVA